MLHPPSTPPAQIQRPHRKRIRDLGILDIYGDPEGDFVLAQRSPFDSDESGLPVSERLELTEGDRLRPVVDLSSNGLLRPKSNIELNARALLRYTRVLFAAVDVRLNEDDEVITGFVSNLNVGTRTATVSYLFCQGGNQPKLRTVQISLAHLPIDDQFDLVSAGNDKKGAIDFLLRKRAPREAESEVMTSAILTEEGSPDEAPTTTDEDTGGVPIPVFGTNTGPGLAALAQYIQAESVTNCDQTNEPLSASGENEGDIYSDLEETVRFYDEIVGAPRLNLPYDDIKLHPAGSPALPSIEPLDKALTCDEVAIEKQFTLGAAILFPEGVEEDGQQKMEWKDGKWQRVLRVRSGITDGRKQQNGCYRVYRFDKESGGILPYVDVDARILIDENRKADSIQEGYADLSKPADVSHALETLWGLDCVTYPELQDVI